MQWLREGLAKLLSSVPQAVLFDVELVVFFDSPLVFRYVKGRVYDKSFDGALDPVLENIWQRKKNAVNKQADLIQSPYYGQSFAHQYLHIIVLDRGLLLIQQTDFTEDLPFDPLLVESLNILLAQQDHQTRLLRYHQWLTEAGMNVKTGRYQFQGEYFTPYPEPVFQQDKNGCYPYAKLVLSLKAPFSVIEVTGQIDPALLPKEFTWYCLGERFFTSVLTTDKRVINKVVNTIKQQLSNHFTNLQVHVARSSDPISFETVLDQLRDSKEVYYPAPESNSITDITVALASTKRYKVRNHQNQWVADLFFAPKMILECELIWLTKVLKQATPRTRYIEISSQFATHPDTVSALKQHKLGGHFTRTAFIANDFDASLTTYIQEKNAIIGTRNWHLMMTKEVDVFLFDHIAGQDDEPLLDYLYHRQMNDGLTVVFPIQQQIDALWLINHNIGLYYMEDNDE